MANKGDERKKALEDEYFVKKEKELIQKLKSKQEKDQEADRTKACYMRCPKCGAALKERSLARILVDQCTGCNGIWLDAGELEQLAGKEQGGWLGKLWQRIG